jgi:hypothetical protein
MTTLGIFISQTLGSELTVLAIFLPGCIDFQKLAFMSPGFDQWLKSLAIRTHIFIFAAIILKISKCKLFGPGPITDPSGKAYGHTLNLIKWAQQQAA